jgi:hypothetical protein
MTDQPRPDRQRFALVVEAQPDEVPAVVRLRRALKVLLRSFRLRAIRAEEVPAALVEGEQAPAPGPGPAAALWDVREFVREKQAEPGALWGTFSRRNLLRGQILA